MRECGQKVRCILPQTVIFIQRLRRDCGTCIRECEFGFDAQVHWDHLQAYIESSNIGPLVDAALKQYKSHRKISENDG